MHGVAWIRILLVLIYVKVHACMVFCCQSSTVSGGAHVHAGRACTCVLFPVCILHVSIPCCALKPLSLPLALLCTAQLGTQLGICRVVADI